MRFLAGFIAGILLVFWAVLDGGIMYFNSKWTCVESRLTGSEHKKQSQCIKYAYEKDTPHE